MSRKAQARARFWLAGSRVAALLLAGLAAWLSLRRVHWPALRAALAGVNVPLLALALATVLVTTVAKAARWQVLLRACGASVGGMRVGRVLLIGQMGNSFLPGRLGDVARAVLVGPQIHGGVLAAMGTLLAEKALDGVMGLLILSGLAMWTPLPGWLRAPILGLAALTGGLLALLGLAATRGRWATPLLAALIRPLPASLQDRLRRWPVELRLGLGLFRRPGSALLALAWSAAVWGVAALTNLVTLAAMGLEAPGWSTWLVLVTGYVANFLPAVPAQVGLFEYACILALTAAGVGPEPALAFGLVLHLLVYGPPAVLGPASMAVEGVSWKKLQAAKSSSLEGDGVSA